MSLQSHGGRGFQKSFFHADLDILFNLNQKIVWPPIPNPRGNGLENMTFLHSSGHSMQFLVPNVFSKLNLTANPLRGGVANVSIV